MKGCGFFKKICRREKCEMEELGEEHAILPRHQQSYARPALGPQQPQPCVEDENEADESFRIVVVGVGNGAGAASGFVLLGDGIAAVASMLTSTVVC
jgi:hypothetical protein